MAWRDRVIMQRHVSLKDEPYLPPRNNNDAILHSQRESPLTRADTKKSQQIAGFFHLSVKFTGSM